MLTVSAEYYARVLLLDVNQKRFQLIEIVLGLEHVCRLRIKQEIWANAHETRVLKK